MFFNGNNVVCEIQSDIVNWNFSNNVWLNNGTSNPVGLMMGLRTKAQLNYGESIVIIESPFSLYMKVMGPNTAIGVNAKKVIVFMEPLWNRGIYRSVDEKRPG